MMVVLANHPNWQVYPEEIAKRKGVSRPTISKYFKILEEAGYLRQVRRKPPGRGGSHVFRFFSDRKISDFQFDIMSQRLDKAISDFCDVSFFHVKLFHVKLFHVKLFHVKLFTLININ